MRGASHRWEGGGEGASHRWEGGGCVIPLGGEGRWRGGRGDVQYCTSPLCSLSPVVVDRREDKNCDTGKFELAYKQVLCDS